MDISQFYGGKCFSKTQAVAPPISENETGPSYRPKPVHRAFVPLQPTNNYRTTANTGAIPQLQAVAKRQYPVSAASARIDITDSFEDDGMPVGDRYKSQAGSKLDPNIESLWSVNWFVFFPFVAGAWSMTITHRRKNTAKKNKTWDGDGMLHQKGTLVRFLSENGKKV